MSAQKMVQRVSVYSKLLTQRMNSKPILSLLLKLAAALVVSALMAGPFYIRYRGGNPPPDPGSKPVPTTHDMAQHLAVMDQFDKALRSGSLYPRWLADYNDGYGLPWLNYYPPGFYYLTEIIHLVTNDWIDALLVVSVLGLAASGLTFYLFSRLFYSRASSAAAALLYMTAPYHTLDLYWRGALPEFMGFAILPVVLYFAYKTGEYGRARYFAGLGLFHGFYLMTHFPVAFLLTLTLGVYALIWAITQRDIRVVLRIGIGIAIALLVGAIYWLPAFFESGLVSVPLTGVFLYDNSYITLMPGVDAFGKLLGQSFVLLAAALIVSLLILHAARKGGFGLPDRGSEAISSSRLQTRFFQILSVATIFMVTPYSIYISQLIPQKNMIAFAWRWLVIVTFFTALVVAAAADHLAEAVESRAVKVWAGRAGIVAVIVAGIWISVGGIMAGAFSNAYLYAPADRKEGAIVLQGGGDPTALPQTPRISFVSGTGAAEALRWEPLHRRIILVAEDQSTIRLKTLNFPGWVARLDGKQVAITSDSNGAQVIEVPAGRHTVDVDFVNTPPRTAGTTLFGLGLALILSLTITDYVRRRAKQQAAQKIVAGDVASEPGSQSLEMEGAKPVTRARIMSRLSSKPIIALLVASAIFITVLIIKFANKTTPGKDASSATSTSASAGSVATGSEARLYNPGGNWTLVAVDRNALGELINALAERNPDKVEAMIESGKALRAENGTRIKILENNSGSAKVRIVEGQYILVEGWVQERWLR